MHRTRCPAGFCAANAERGQCEHRVPLCRQSNAAGPAGAKAVQGGAIARRQADGSHGDQGALSQTEHLETGAGAHDLPLPSEIPGRRYLAAVPDWFTRPVPVLRVLVSLEAGFCQDALEKALTRHGLPEIFDSDQGRQFTSTDVTKMLASREIKISMDGKSTLLRFCGLT